MPPLRRGEPTWKPMRPWRCSVDHALVEHARAQHRAVERGHLVGAEPRIVRGIERAVLAQALDDVLRLGVARVARDRRPHRQVGHRRGGRVGPVGVGARARATARIVRSLFDGTSNAGHAGARGGRRDCFEGAHGGGGTLAKPHRDCQRGGHVVSTSAKRGPARGPTRDAADAACRLAGRAARPAARRARRRSRPRPRGRPARTPAPAFPSRRARCR